MVCVIDFIYPPKPLYKFGDGTDKKEDKDSGDELVGIFSMFIMLLKCCDKC